MSPLMVVFSADPASVAGGVSINGRDRGKRPLRNRCDMGGACLLGGDTTDAHGANGAAAGGVHGVGDTTSKSTSVLCGMTDS